MKPKIYLAGPMKDCTKEESSKWRNDLKHIFKDRVEFFDPVDFEIAELNYEQLVKLDIAYISKCDFIVANVWKLSAGTMMELVYAKFNQKPVLTLTVEQHAGPWLKYHSNVLVFDSEELIEKIKEFIKEHYEKGID